MQKGLFTLILTLGMGIFSFAQTVEVEEVQRSLVTKKTATWCPHCGAWGWTMFEGLINDNSEKAVLMAAHYDGGLENDVALAITNNFGGSSQPRFFLGNVDQGVSSGNTNSKLTEIKGLIDANNLLSPVVNTGLVAVKDVMDETMVTIYSKSKFFQDADGEYYMGIYVIEDKVLSIQSGLTGEVEHHNILRAGLTADNNFGLALNSGAVTASTEFDNEHTFQLDAAWNVENLTFAAIVWKKNGATYDFVNVSAINEFTVLPPVVGTSNIELDLAQMNVLPTISTDLINVSLDLKENSEAVQLTLIDVSGRQLKTLFTGDLSSGTHAFELNRSMVANAGMYFVNLSIDGKTLTKKIVFK